MKTNLLTIGLLICTLLVNTSFGMDVRTKNGARWIKVELNSTKEYVKFTKCTDNDCNEPIGSGKWYSISKIQTQRSDEKLDVLWSSLGLVALTATAGSGVAYLGLAAGGTIALGISTADSAALIGAVVGGTVGYSGSAMFMAKTFDKLNPVEQFNQAEAVKDEIILDRLVLVNSVDEVEAIAERIEVVLGNINY